MAANIQTALGNLPGVGAANVSVTMSSSTTFSITFAGTLGNAVQPPLTSSDKSATLLTNYQYASGTTAGSPPVPQAYPGAKGNWRSDNIVVHGTTVSAAPALVGSPVVNGDSPNGLSGVQRSMVQDVVYTFSSPVTIPNAAAAFTVTAAGPNPGTAPASLSAAAVAGSNGTQWEVTLTGGAAGALGSIANGEYNIAVNASGVFSAADGTTPLAAGRTDQFYRLYGDINGDEVVNGTDNFQFKKALTTYNPAFDVNGDGFVNGTDNFQFKKSLLISYLGDGFTPTI